MTKSLETPIASINANREYYNFEMNYESSIVDEKVYFW